MPTDRVLLATIDDYVRDKIEPGTIEQRVLPGQLMRHGSVEFGKGGPEVKWPVRNLRVGNFRENDVFQDITVSPEKSEVMVSEGYGRYLANEFLDMEEELVNKGQMERIYDLAQSKIDGMSESVKDEWAQELHDGPGTGRRIFGLNEIMPDSYTASVVHGQAQTANVWWQHLLVDAAGGPNSNEMTDLLWAIRYAIMGSDRGQGGPDFGITTPDIYERIVQKHQAQERYDATGNVIGTALKFITVHNTPIMYDKLAEADNIRFLKAKHWRLWFRTPGMFFNEVVRPTNKQGRELRLSMFPHLSCKNLRDGNAVVYNIADLSDPA